MATKTNSVKESLEASITAAVFANRETSSLINSLTGLVLEEVEKVRGEDVDFHDAIHPEVFNVILASVSASVKLIVENWEHEDFKQG